MCAAVRRRGVIRPRQLPRTVANLAGFVLVLLLAVSARADLVSTFDSDAESWSIYGNGAAAVPDYEPAGGNPGGFIGDSDAVADLWYFGAPPAWSGDMTAYVGGTLSYQIIILQASQSYVPGHDVVIWHGLPGLSGSAYLYWDSGILPPKPPDQAWTDFSVSITPENFSVWRPAGSDATFESIIAGVTAVHIRGEYIGAGDREGLDNVFLRAPDTSVGIGPALPVRPETTRLARLHPNPFNPRIQVAYELATAGPAEITVHDPRGRLIRTLVLGSKPAGRHETEWDGRDEAGRRLSSGVYFVRLLTRDVQDARKVTLAK